MTLTLTLQLTGWLWSLWGWSSKGCDLSTDHSDPSTESAGHLAPAVLSWARPQSNGLVATIAPTSAFQLSQQAGMGRDFFQLQAGGFSLPVSGLNLLKRRLVFLEAWALDSTGASQVCLQGNNPKWPVLTWPGAKPGTVGTGDPTGIISPEVLTLLTHSYPLTFVSKLWIYRGPRRSFWG